MMKVKITDTNMALEYMKPNNCVQIICVRWEYLKLYNSVQIICIRLEYLKIYNLIGILDISVHKEMHYYFMWIVT